MGQNFIGCDREQELLLPPSLRDWLPASPLAWFVLDAVEAVDLAAFYASYRADGWGRAAFEPSMMVALTVYAYSVGSGPRGRSSGVAARMSRFGLSAGTSRRITRRSRAFAFVIRTRSRTSSTRS